MVMGGRGHLVGIKAHGKGLMMSILRYAQEFRECYRASAAVSAHRTQTTVGVKINHFEIVAGFIAQQN